MVVAQRPDPEARLRRSASPKRLHTHLKAFGKWHRETGGADERAAVDYMMDELRRQGIAVRLHEFRGFVSIPRNASLDVLSPDAQSVPCRPRSFGANTPLGGIDGEVVFAGSLDEDRSKMIFARTGDDHDFDGVDARGKIVLGTAGGPDGVKRAAEAGAIAYVHMWPSGEDALHEMIVTSIWGRRRRSHLPGYPRFRRYRSRKPTASDCIRCYDAARLGCASTQRRTPDGVPSLS